MNYIIFDDKNFTDFVPSRLRFGDSMTDKNGVIFNMATYDSKSVCFKLSNTQHFKIHERHFNENSLSFMIPLGMSHERFIDKFSLMENSVENIIMRHLTPGKTDKPELNEKLSKHSGRIPKGFNDDFTRFVVYSSSNLKNKPKSLTEFYGKGISPVKLLESFDVKLRVRTNFKNLSIVVTDNENHLDKVVIKDISQNTFKRIFCGKDVIINNIILEFSKIMKIPSGLNHVSREQSFRVSYALRPIFMEITILNKISNDIIMKDYSQSTVINDREVERLYPSNSKGDIFGFVGNNKVNSIGKVNTNINENINSIGKINSII